MGHAMNVDMREYEALRALAPTSFDLGRPVRTVPLTLTGDMESTFRAWKMCFEGGLYTNAVVPPAVPADMGLLRTSYMATHTDDQIDFALEVLGNVGRELNLID